MTSTGALRRPSARSPSIHVEEIRTVSGFKALEPQWNMLLERCNRPGVYLTYEWMTSWWECFGNDGKDLLILVVRRGREIIGIAPLMEVKDHFLGLPIRRIEFISMMQYADSPTNLSGSLDMIVPEHHIEVVGVIFDHLTKYGLHWNMIRLNPTPKSSEAMRVFEESARRHGYRTEERVVFLNASVEVNKEWTDYAAGLSPQFTKSLRKQERSLAKVGEFTFQEFKVNGSNGEAERLYDEIMDVEKRSWKWNVGVSLNSVALKNFYRVFAREAAKRGWLSVGMLQANGRNIAYVYNVDYRGCVSSLKTSYDEEYSRYGPGNLLTWHEFEYFFNHGTKRISLLWGDLSKKRCWAPTLEPHEEMLVFNRGFAGTVFHFLWVTCALLRHRRLWRDRKNRIARKIGLHLKHSELTRLDQLAHAKGLSF